MVTNAGSVFDKALKKLVKKTGQPLNRVAVKSQIPQPCLWNWYNGKSNLSDDTVAKLAAYLSKQRGLGEATSWLMQLHHAQRGIEWLQEQLVKYQDDAIQDPDDWAKTQAVVEKGVKDFSALI